MNYCLSTLLQGKSLLCIGAIKVDEHCCKNKGDGNGASVQDEGRNNVGAAGGGISGQTGEAEEEGTTPEPRLPQESATAASGQAHHLIPLVVVTIG